MAKTEPNYLWEQEKHDKKEIESFRELTRVDGKIQELEYQLKEVKRKFEVEALVEREACKAQLDTTNISFEKGHEGMSELIGKVVKKHNAGKGIIIPNQKVVFEWLKVDKLEDANAHARRKDKAHKKVSQSCSIVASMAHPSSSKYILQDPHEDNTETITCYQSKWH